MIANAATVGSIIENKEDGWNRYDNDNDKIKYNGEGWQAIQGFSDKYGKNTFLVAPANNSSIEFKFNGSKLRIYGNRNCGNIITIDEQDYEMPSYQIDNRIKLCYENTSLNVGIHSIKIRAGSSNRIDLDAIDIDGNLIEGEDISLLLDKSLTLKEGSTKKLTATTTPASVDVEWSSSDETIATVDENGKVTGIKEGTCIIIAQIKGTDVKATCEVTVTKEDIVEPEEPSIENGSLYIEMIDGNIKRADKSQIEKFKKWFISRDLDETESPIFKITNAKGNVEYLVHDKVVGFEIRE